jgi:hypothetical protein
MAENDEPMVEYLERDQLVADRSIPLPRKRLSRRVRIGLWVLRVVVFVFGAMVVYTFVWALGH